MRYLDSADRAPGSTARVWLEHLLPTTVHFACQTGYFRAPAIAGHGARIRDLLDKGGTFQLVVGANEDRLVADDLDAVLDIIEPWLGGTARFALVGAADALFHPKTYYCELSDGSRHALIGSANLTPSGLGRNVEACLALTDTVDDPSALDATRDAIAAWFDPARAANTRNLSRLVIKELASERVIEPTEFSAPAQRSRTTPSVRRLFPAFAGIFPSGQRRRTPPRKTPIIGALPGSVPFPPGTIGMVKLLSPSQDLKGFAGRSGTPYIALPSALAQHLPMTPMGANQEPRVGIAIEARLGGSLTNVVRSGSDPTNITWVGMGPVAKSHHDLRLNTLQTVTRGLLYVHANTGAAVPQGGDPLTIEFLDGGRFVRLTFATEEPLRSALVALCTTLRGASGWGWLPAGAVPPW